MTGGGRSAISLLTTSVLKLRAASLLENSSDDEDRVVAGRECENLVMFV